MQGTLTTTIIITAILILFSLSISKKSIRNYKNEIVSLGVLGTFIGIAMGLYHFDVTNIKDSMPYLLNGLKTAFITSGVGIFFSVIISIYKPVQSKKSETLNVLEMVVKEFNKNLTTQFGDNFKQLNESVKAMVTWQDNYKDQIIKSEDSLNNILSQLNKIELMKESEQKNIEAIVYNLKQGSTDVKNSLTQTTNIVKEQMQLLLREANRKL